jgi:hypothetical protein
MSVWGKSGKEYYSWYIENIDELEEFIIEHDIDVDHVEEYHMYAFDKSWYSLKHQANRRSMLYSDDIMHLTLVSFSNPCRRHQSFKAIKTVVF